MWKRGNGAVWHGRLPAKVLCPMPFNRRALARRAPFQARAAVWDGGGVLGAHAEGGVRTAEMRLTVYNRWLSLIIHFLLGHGHASPHRSTVIVLPFMTSYQGGTRWAIENGGCAL